jgi:hypothetical protein
VTLGRAFRVLAWASFYAALGVVLLGCGRDAPRAAPPAPPVDSSAFRSADAGLSLARSLLSLRCQMDLFAAHWPPRTPQRVEAYRRDSVLCSSLKALKRAAGALLAPATRADSAPWYSFDLVLEEEATEEPNPSSHDPLSTLMAGRSRPVSLELGAIGPFRTRTGCDSVEATLHRAGWATSKCRARPTFSHQQSQRDSQGTP